MSEVVNSEPSEGGQVILGDETSQQAISFKMAQAFYSEITGKSEKICEKFNKSFILTIENVEQLHKRIIQATTQYSVATANASFSVEYQNDSSERFSSIDRFKTHAGTKGVPVEEVDISYHFLIILPDTKKPQEYRINIRLVSRAVKLEDIKEQTKGMPFSVPLWRFDNALTCRASIDFIDITVANAFMSVVKTWNSGLEEVEVNEFLNKLRAYARYMPALFKYGLLTAGVFYTLKVVDVYFSSATPQTTAMFVLIAYLFNFILWKAGLFLGKKAEHHLNQLYDVSYIGFSGADQTLAKKCKAAKRKNTLSSLGYLAGTFFLGVLASGAATYIFKS